MPRPTFLLGFTQATDKDPAYVDVYNSSLVLAVEIFPVIEVGQRRQARLKNGTNVEFEVLDIGEYSFQ